MSKELEQTQIQGSRAVKVKLEKTKIMWDVWNLCKELIENLDKSLTLKTRDLISQNSHFI